MTVTFPGTHSQRINSVTAWTIDLGAMGAVAGDVLVLAVMSDAQGVAMVPTPSTGWTKVVDQVNTGTRVNWVWARTLTSGEITSGIAFAAASGNRTYQAILVRGAAALAGWVWSATGNRAGSGGTFSTTIPSVTTTEANMKVLALGTEATATNESLASPPTSTKGTLLDWSTADTAINVTESVVSFQYTQAVAGATGTVTITWLNTQASNSIGIQVAIPVFASPEDHSAALSVGWKRGSGDIVAGKLVAKLGAGAFVDVKGFVRVPTGFANIDQMLRQPLFEVAHRGGSVSFPEMSLHAYTQSVILGYKALEISLNRTSDGVWVGVHDATLDRTSTPDTGLTVSALTWAQVQTHTINVGPQAPKPYMRLEQLLDAYGRTHVLFMDPKAALSFRQELLNKLQTYYGSNAEAAKHVVAKYYGIEGNAGGTSGWAFDAHARGYKTWGYFYQAEVDNAQIDTYAGRWDILGMDYGANSAAWTKVKSFGKPVIAHILPSAASKTAAMAFSPNGLMIGGTALIAPSGY